MKNKNKVTTLLKYLHGPPRGRGPARCVRPMFWRNDLRNNVSNTCGQRGWRQLWPDSFMSRAWERLKLHSDSTWGSEEEKEEEQEEGEGEEEEVVQGSRGWRGCGGVSGGLSGCRILFGPGGCGVVNSWGCSKTRLKKLNKTFQICTTAPVQAQNGISSFLFVCLETVCSAGRFISPMPLSLKVSSCVWSSL